MLGVHEYLEIKSRLLLAAECCHQIARSPELLARYEQEYLAEVLQSLAWAKTDARRLMSECDVLRAMFQESIFPGGGDGRSAEDGSDTDSGLPAQAVPAEEAVGSGGVVRDDGATVDRPAVASGPPRKPRGRPKSRRNTPPSPGVSRQLGRTDDGGEVGGDQGKTAD